MWWYGIRRASQQRDALRAERANRRRPAAFLRQLADLTRRLDDAVAADRACVHALVAEQAQLARVAADGWEIAGLARLDQTVPAERDEIDARGAVEAELAGIAADRRQLA